jgi:hypothetical protein
MKLTSDLEECEAWIVILECLSWRCQKHGRALEREACDNLLCSGLYPEREDYQTQQKKGD